MSLEALAAVGEGLGTCGFVAGVTAVL